MGIKNTKAFWPPNFPPQDQTIVVPEGPSGKFTYTGHKWINYNGRLFAMMPTHCTTDPHTRQVITVKTRYGYKSGVFTEIEVKPTEAVVLWDTRFYLEASESTDKDLVYHYEVSKVAKKEPIEFKLDVPTQFTFETVAHYSVDGVKYYITLGSIGERRVDFYIWNSDLETIQILDFRTNTWCKVLDFVFQLQRSTENTAEIVMHKQSKREVNIQNDVIMTFDEIITFKDGDKEVTMQALKMAPLHPGYFDMWCTLDEKGKPQVTTYLDGMREREKKQFAIAYSIKCNSIEHPPNEPPKFNLTITVVDSPTVDFNSEFVLSKGQSVRLTDADLTLRYDGSSHKHGEGFVEGFIHVTTTKNGEEKSQRVSVGDDENKTKSFRIDNLPVDLLEHTYDTFIKLRLNNIVRKKTKKISLDPNC